MIAVALASMVTEDAFPALSDACSCGSWSRRGAETTRDRDGFASRCPRCVWDDCAFVRGLRTLGALVARIPSARRFVGPKRASYWAIQRATRLGSRLDRRRNGGHTLPRRPTVIENNVATARRTVCSVRVGAGQHFEPLRLLLEQAPGCPAGSSRSENLARKRRPRHRMNLVSRQAVPRQPSSDSRRRRSSVATSAAYRSKR